LVNCSNGAGKSKPAALKTKAAAPGQGKYPLSKIDVRVVDLNKFAQKTADGHVLSLQEFLANDVKIQIDELAANSSALNLSWNIPFTDINKQDFRVFYGARNGFWNEDLAIRRVNGECFEALKVWKDSGKKSIVVFSKIDPGFPLNENGKVDWPK
jgi:hypothetical protein